MRVLCSICTYKRYDSTLPLAIASVINQTRLPDKFVVYDDNDEPRDVREDQTYSYLFQMMSIKGIEWEWVWSLKKGQHHSHQMANEKAAREGYDWVWRMDDDTIAESKVLENLLSCTSDEIGAVGGSILTPPNTAPVQATAKIEDVYHEPNVQWGVINDFKEVDHLHCSFLYRPGVVDYNLALSRVAHREETLFTWGLKKKGYKLLVVPDAVTWHLKNNNGGIRAENNNKLEMFEHDERIFKAAVETADRTVVVLDCGMGDHLVFSHVLPDVKNPLVFSCYPEIVPGRSIAEAYQMFGDIGKYNVYAKMDEWNWTGSLEDAYRKMYVEAA